MIDTSVIANILNKKINGQLTLHDQQILDEWVNLSPYNRGILHKIEEENLLFEDVMILLEWTFQEDEEKFISKITKDVLSQYG